MNSEKTYSVEIEVRYDSQMYGRHASDIRPTESDIENMKSGLMNTKLTHENECVGLINVCVKDTNKTYLHCNAEAAPDVKKYDLLVLELYMCLKKQCLCKPKDCPGNIINGKCQNEFIRNTVFNKLFVKEKHK